MVAPSAPAHVAFIETWMQDNKPADNAAGYDRTANMQFYFVYGHLAPFFVGVEQYTHEVVHVVGDYVMNEPAMLKYMDTVSPPIKMPVYMISDPKTGITAIIKGDIYTHNWFVSVSADTPLVIDFGDLVDTTATVDTTLLDGFEPEWIFEPYAVNQQQFTLQLKVIDDEEMYVLFWLLRNSRRA